MWLAKAVGSTYPVIYCHRTDSTIDGHGALGSHINQCCISPADSAWVLNTVGDASYWCVWWFGVRSENAVTGKNNPTEACR